MNDCIALSDTMIIFKDLSNDDSHRQKISCSELGETDSWPAAKIHDYWTKIAIILDMDLNGRFICFHILFRMYRKVQYCYANVFLFDSRLCFKFRSGRGVGDTNRVLNIISTHEPRTYMHTCKARKDSWVNAFITLLASSCWLQM